MVTTTTVASATAFPSTDRRISDEELLVMNPDAEALGKSYRNLEPAVLSLESNADLVRKSLQDPNDEAADIDRFMRRRGSRAVFNPRWFRVGTAELLGLEFWVAIFLGEAGAQGYLADFVQDAAKGVGGGVPSDLIVAQADEFTVEELGEEAVGLVLSERDPGEEVSRFQTLVGFRIGRVLGFVSVLHRDEGDRRVRALTLAGDFEDRVTAVLARELLPPEPPPQPQELESYAFSYRQVIGKGRTTGIISAEGVEVVGSGLECLVTVDLGGGVVNRRRYIVVDDRAWVNAFDPEAPGFRSTSPHAFFTASDLIYCPGWPVELVPSGLDLVLAGQPIEEVEVEEAPSLQYSLGYDEAVGTGFIPEGSSIEIEEFSVVTDAVSPWTRSLRLAASGSSAAFAEAYGNDFVAFSGRRVSVVIEFTATRINDRDIAVSPP